MPRKKVIGVAAAPAMEVTSTHPEAVIVSATEFHVYGPDGGYRRTYSLADHGEEAEAKAHEYATTSAARSNKEYIVHISVGDFLRGGCSTTKYCVHIVVVRNYRARCLRDIEK